MAYLLIGLIGLALLMTIAKKAEENEGISLTRFALAFGLLMVTLTFSLKGAILICNQLS